MKKILPNIEQQLRAAILDSGLSVNEIAKGCGIPQPTVFRFVAEQTSLQLVNAAKVAEYFGMRLTRPTRKATRKRPDSRTTIH